MKINQGIAVSKLLGGMAGAMFCLGAVAQTTDVTIGTMPATPGGEIDLPVAIVNNHDVASVDLELAIDESGLAYRGGGAGPCGFVHAGPVLEAQGGTINCSDLGGGAIKVITSAPLAAPEDIIYDDGDLFFIRLTATGNDGDSVPVVFLDDIGQQRMNDNGGTFIGQENFTLNDGEVNIEGVPPVCDLSIAPVSHNFGNVDVGSSSTHTFTLTNNSGDPCTGLDAEVGPTPPFDGVGTDCDFMGGALAAGESCDIEVSFSPTAEGNFSGSLDVTADGAEASAALTGSSVPVVPVIGVPTLQAWGLALMALLMLTIGVFSVRAFRS